MKSVVEKTNSYHRDMRRLKKASNKKIRKVLEIESGGSYKKVLEIAWTIS